MIELKYLSKTFQMKDGAVKALQNINLTIPDGAIYGIIGMSGAGKSTLVRCINLLERPTEGSVVIDGVEMEKLTPAQLRQRRREITMIFQQFKELLAKEGVKEIEAKGKDFDPETMNAVMHIEDENFGENEVSQVFQAGFELNGKVLRHAIVQVAN